LQEAIADCKKAIALDAAYIKGHMRLGYMYFQLKDYPNAVLAYKAGLVHEPTNEALQNDLAKAQSFCTPTATNNNNGMGGMGGMGGLGGAGGMPDMSQFAAMMQNQAGGGAGGMPNFMEMMSDPQFMQAAQQFMMGNPQLMQWYRFMASGLSLVHLVCCLFCVLL
jgi:small glutamine-rich tetratricopeptide repeat-containing protein alpha